MALWYVEVVSDREDGKLKALRVKASKDSSPKAQTCTSTLS